MSTPQPPLPGTEALVEALRVQLETQPWYRRFANTVTSGAGALVLILWLVIASGVEVPPEVLAGVSGLISVLTTVGVLGTRNGVTPSEVEHAEKVARVVVGDRE